MSLREQALQLLLMSDPDHKAAAVRALVVAGAQTGAAALLAEPSGIPGRPARPELVPHTALRRRPVGTPAGRALLLHSLAHIEHNAINLALDAVWRFQDMPDAYYRDWLRVAQEEALHFALLHAHLRAQGNTYGDFPAHDSLWQMCERTRDDIVARMALVPRTLEARGLDAAPLIQAKLRRIATPDALRAVDILDTILHDEVGHVAIGNHWYRWLCMRDGIDPVAHYTVLAARHGAPRLRPPFNTAARRRAGFTDDELALLQD